MKVGNQNNLNLVLGHFLFLCLCCYGTSMFLQVSNYCPCRLIRMTHPMCLRDIHPTDAISHISAEIKQAQLQLAL